MLIWLWFCAFLSYVAAQCNNIEEDTRLDTLSLIQKYGYEAESHEVETEDGYILTMHRILPKGNPEGKSPIILQHGLLCSSADWVLMGPNYSFGYILADAGYDVWLGNNRGNKYSRKHKSLDANKNAEKFWDFSWNEMGKYDLPAEIDYVLSKTDQESLFYAGHSQGTTQFFVMGSLRPEYNDKIKLMGAFAPVAFMGRAPSPFLHLLSPLVYLAERVRKLIGVNEFLPSSGINTQAGELLCRDKARTQRVCSNFLFLMAGYDTKELNETMLPVIMGHTPAGASSKQFLHYAQNVVMKNHFREWDYTISNFKRYNRMSPPDYPLKNVNSSVALFYSKNDWMSAVSDVQRLWNEITNVVNKTEVKTSDGKGYNHLDYLYGTHAPELVYKKYMELMEQYQ